MNKLIKYFNENYGTKKKRKQKIHLDCKNFIPLGKGFIVPYDMSNYFEELHHQSDLYLRTIIDDLEEVREDMLVEYDYEMKKGIIANSDYSFGAELMILTEETLDYIRENIIEYFSPESIEKIENNIGGTLFVTSGEFSSIKLFQIYSEEAEKEYIIKDCKPNSFIYDFDNIQINIFEDISSDILNKILSFEITYIDEFEKNKKIIFDKNHYMDKIFYDGFEIFAYVNDFMTMTIANGYTDTNYIKHNIVNINIYNEREGLGCEIKNMSIYNEIPYKYILKLEYPKNKKDFYRAYSFLKTIIPQLNDSKLTELFNEVEVPKPKNADELELYMDCVDEISKEEIIIEFKEHEIMHFPTEFIKDTPLQDFGEEMDCFYGNFDIEDLDNLYVELNIGGLSHEKYLTPYVFDEYIVLASNSFPLFYSKISKKIYVPAPYEMFEEDDKVILKRIQAIPIINSSVHYINNEKDNYYTIKKAINEGKTLLTVEDDLILSLSYEINKDEKWIELYSQGYRNCGYTVDGVIAE